MNMNFKLDVASVVELVKLALSVVYYPVWIACSLIHTFLPLKEGKSFNKLFDEETVKDEQFEFNALLSNEQIKPNEEEKQVRDKIIQSILKINGLDTKYLKDMVNGKEKGIFSVNELTFEDPMVSYTNYDEWLMSFYALSYALSAKIDNVLSIEHYDQLIVIKFTMKWMTPFNYINENIFGGITLNDVMILKLNSSNKVTNIYEFWNGKNYFNFFGLIQKAKRNTALFTLPIIYGTKYVSKRLNCC